MKSVIHEVKVDLSDVAQELKNIIKDINSYETHYEKLFILSEFLHSRNGEISVTLNDGICEYAHYSSKYQIFMNAEEFKYAVYGKLEKWLIKEMKAMDPFIAASIDEYEVMMELLHDFRAVGERLGFDVHIYQDVFIISY